MGSQKQALIPEPLTFMVLVVMLSSGCSTKNKQISNNSFPSKIPVLIDTDLGGDPDDIQSLFRLLHYSDILEIKGIVSTPCSQLESHPWDTIPQDKLIKEWIQRIDMDHLRNKGFTELMGEYELLQLVKKGSQQPQAPSKLGKTEGSEYLSELAKQYRMENPLWILVWGSMTTLAQALHDHPSIGSNIRIYSIGSTNTEHDSLSRNFVYDFMEKEYPELWWIENAILPKGKHETFRGVYQGGEQSGEWGNIAFVENNIRGKGTTRKGMFDEKSGDAFPVATWPKGTLKEGDSPSILYLISPLIGGVGDIHDPTQESWGGQFRKAYPEKFPNYYVDLDASPEECQATINKWRLDFMADWKKRWERYD
ncbi:nucleoside hydrolase-like domain-containing protein [Shivajiella indica]|uniref:Nucleoside hydrolase-like domain-containing protein n=1 Tax=Shivajiella indica TaxID=872115 RepID=A0ABW5B2S3_9BACT